VIRNGLAIYLLFVIFCILVPPLDCLGKQSPATLSPGLTAENDSEKELLETLRRNVEISLQDSGNERQTLFAICNLGEIVCERSYILNLQLTNDSEKQLIFDDISTGCVCQVR